MASLAGPGSAKDPNLEDGETTKTWEKSRGKTDGINRFGECTNISKSFVCTLFIYYIVYIYVSSNSNIVFYNFGTV